MTCRNGGLAVVLRRLRFLVEMMMPPPILSPCLDLQSGRRSIVGAACPMHSINQSSVSREQIF